MSSPSVARVVRRRSVKSRFGVALQMGKSRIRRQADVRVKITVRKSAADTSFAPSKVSEATSMESCTLAGRGRLACPRAIAGVAKNSDTATSARREETSACTDGCWAQRGGLDRNAKNGPKT